MIEIVSMAAELLLRALTPQPFIPLDPNAVEVIGRLGFGILIAMVIYRATRTSIMPLPLVQAQSWVT